MGSEESQTPFRRLFLLFVWTLFCTRYRRSSLEMKERTEFRRDILDGKMVHATYQRAELRGGWYVGWKQWKISLSDVRKSRSLINFQSIFKSLKFFLLNTLHNSYKISDECIALIDSSPVIIEKIIINHCWLTCIWQRYALRALIAQLSIDNRLIIDWLSIYRLIIDISPPCTALLSDLYSEGPGIAIIQCFFEIKTRYGWIKTRSQSIIPQRSTAGKERIINRERLWEGVQEVTALPLRFGIDPLSWIDTIEGFSLKGEGFLHNQGLSNSLHSPCSLAALADERAWWNERVSVSAYSSYSGHCCTIIGWPGERCGAWREKHGCEWKRRAISQEIPWIID